MITKNLYETYTDMIPYHSVAHLGESIICAGFPKKITYDNMEFTEQSKQINDTGDVTVGYKRMKTLAQTPDGSGHSNFRKGITVYLNVVASQVWWLQALRYSHFTPVSSFSKMHCLRGFLDSNIQPLNVDTRIMDVLQELNTEEDINDEVLADNCPMGLPLACGVTTNYAQLRTIWVQRHNHKKKEWRLFCEWIESLPFADELICYDKVNK